MDDFIARLDLREALELYIFLQGQEEALSGASSKILAALRAYLYDRLSIEDMEFPSALLAKL